MGTSKIESSSTRSPPTTSSAAPSTASTTVIQTSTTTEEASTTFQPGEWVLIQSRSQNGNPVDMFAKSWNEYVDGFSAGDESWIGLDTIHHLTTDGRWELTVGDYDYSTSTLGDGLKYHSGAAFSTPDMDQDNSAGNCAHRFGEGGWWFHK